MTTANNYMNESMLEKTQKKKKKIFIRPKRRLFTNAEISTIRLRACRNLFKRLPRVLRQPRFSRQQLHLGQNWRRKKFILKSEKTSTLASKWSSLPTSLKT